MAIVIKSKCSLLENNPARYRYSGFPVTEPAENTFGRSNTMQMATVVGYGKHVF